MCESTDFIKENDLFVCQGCGCKYPMEEAKKLLREIPDEPTTENSTQTVEESKTHFENIAPPIEPKSQPQKPNIPIHNENSPNSLYVKVIKVGHETYTAASMTNLSTLFGGEPQPVFMEGPDCVGHIGAEIMLRNVTGKPIKYVTVYLAPYNAVGDRVSCTVQGHSVFGIEITGPINVGDSWEGYSDGMWYNNSIVGARINHVHVIYMDNTEEIYDGNEFYPTPRQYKENNSSQSNSETTTHKPHDGTTAKWLCGKCGRTNVNRDTCWYCETSFYSN